MKHLLYRIVRRLRDPGAPLSRNRHFAAFDQPEGRQAFRMHRHMRSLEADILSHEDPSHVRVVRSDDEGTVRVEVRLPATRASRTAVITREQLELLLETPRVGEVLRRACWEPSEG